MASAFRDLAEERRFEDRDVAHRQGGEVPGDGEELAAREAARHVGQDGVGQRPDQAVDQGLEGDRHAGAPASQPRVMPRRRCRKGSWWSKIARRRSVVRPLAKTSRPLSMMAIILTKVSTS